LNQNNWHKRWHPLRQTWVVHAGHRNNRPWTVGKQDHNQKLAPEHDPNCYLCAGNMRVGGHQNPDYQSIFIFENDHPVVGPLAPFVSPSQDFYKMERAYGLAKVICYSPRHDMTMAEMPIEKVIEVFQAWKDETIEISKIAGIKNLLIFENKGEIVGVSNPHPHGQLYAVDFTLTLNKMYLEASEKFMKETGDNLFSKIIGSEISDGSRIIAENKSAIAFVPYFARYAYETLVFPKNPHATMESLSDKEIADLAEVYLTVIRKMDGLFNMSFPYVMTINQAPFDLKDKNMYQLHWQLLPPLRQPDLKKFPAGPEIGAETFMADTIPEEKARELQAISVSL
jgi:UDPglucose--hexose-1-phosphate uridylyltransferase